MSEAADFIDAALQYEVSPYVWPDEADGLLRYGTSIGAIRGTIRDALKRYPGMSHDEITRLSSELWAVPALERRQAAIVLLQTHLELLVANDLTRLEGFVRSAGAKVLADQLVTDVIAPMVTRMDGAGRAKVRVVLARWEADSHPQVSAAGRSLNATGLDRMD
jgi:hypothetical protein